MGFGLVHVDGHRRPSQHLGYALHQLRSERAADVVRVVVGDEHARQAHAVGLDDVEQLVDPVGRVDDHGVAGLAITDEVDEVDHLRCERVVGCEVAT